MEGLKKMGELQKGECIVVCKNQYSDTVKHFKGIYNPKLDMVFMCIAGHYDILGYMQRSEEHENNHSSHD